MKVNLNYQFSINKYALVNKFVYKNTFDLPSLKKVCLSFGFEENKGTTIKTIDEKRIASAMLSLEVIAFSQRGKVTRSKNSNVRVKLRRGYPAGCKVTLRKKRMSRLISRFLIDALPRVKDFSSIPITKKLQKSKAFYYKLRNAYVFKELESQHQFFKSLPYLNITFVASEKIFNELPCLLSSLHLPLTTK